MYTIQPLTDFSHSEMDQIVSLWESSVRATHDFLDEQAILDLRPQVREGAQAVQVFLVIKDAEDQTLGFAGIEDHQLEMLFVHAQVRGQGLDQLLLKTCICDYGVTHVDVNEQNPQALGFYQYFGFQVVGRSARDSAGDPYPILHLELKAGSKGLLTRK